MRSRSSQIDKILKEQGIRVTQARRSIFDALLRSADPLSAAQIDETLQTAGISIDLVTVYRTLDTLERSGLITRIDRPADGWRYAPRSRTHCHSIVCSACGATSPLDRCELERLETQLARSTGFANISHSLQFFGTCPDCQN
jgi:Fur family ferric uptake transcriptional regulator